MYECLTGQPPVQGDSLIETMQKQVTTAPVPLTVFTAGEKFPPQLEQVIMKTLKKAPNDRFRSMEELHDELIRISGGEPPDRPNKTTKQPAVTISVRKIAYAIAGGIAGIIVAFNFAKPTTPTETPDTSSAFAQHTLTRTVDKGEKLIESGDYDEGERVLTAAADNAERFTVKDHGVVDRISSLAQLCHKRGQCDTAERLLKRSLAISEKLFGPTDPRTAERVQDLAAFYMSLGDYDKAEPLYNRIMPEEQARKIVRNASANETSADSPETK
jgi:tetratricopeptide (TPR) repeat protein